MSIKVMTRVWESAPCSFGSLLVMLALADYSDDRGVSYPAVASLARKARLTERQVQRILREIEAQGLVSVALNAGPHGCNVYTIQEGRQFVGGDIGVSQMSPEPSGTVNTTLVDTSSIQPSKKTSPTLVNGPTRARATLDDEAFMAELRERFHVEDFDYELQKWRDHVAVKPPRGNYKNSLRNWMERVAVEPNESQDWLERRYRQQHYEQTKSGEKAIGA